ncbi:MAG: AraC family transcriptional regulator [Desulfobacterales bacterium]|nr:AraC family transcriptional regulator [Desulfobacterales bacterium]
MAQLKESSRYLRVPELGNLELLHARYNRQKFSPHFHEGHVIGTIEDGQLGFDYRGETLTACKGQINLADPGEVHNGFAVSETGWQYRMFYLAPGQLESIVNDGRDITSPMPFFRKGVLRDPHLAAELLSLHRDFTTPGIPFLEKESRFYHLIHRVVARHAPEPADEFHPGREKDRILKVKAYIQAHYKDSVTLEDLSRISAMSKYYLLRTFAARTGFTPHAYLSYVRAVRAREMMDRKVPLADVALSAGFFDQSHLNRIFKKIYGITPGQYAGAFQ